jgi:hypothetical protein
VETIVKYVKDKEIVKQETKEELNKLNIENKIEEVEEWYNTWK